MSATFANLRTDGCFAFRALHKSYRDCMFIHNSGLVPKAAARRIAMAAEISALPLSTRKGNACDPQMRCRLGHGNTSKVFAKN